MTVEGAATGSVARARPKILLVEDDLDMQQLVRLVLRDRCDVYVAANAVQARAQLTDHGGEIRMILMDLTLDGPESGLDLTREVRRKVPWRRIPIVAETARVQPQDRAAALAAGCDHYLTKPYYPTELRTVVDHYLGQTSRC